MNLTGLKVNIYSNKLMFFTSSSRGLKFSTDRLFCAPEDLYMTSYSSHQSGVQVTFLWPIFSPAQPDLFVRWVLTPFSCWKCLKNFQPNVTEYLHPRDIRTLQSTSCSAHLFHKTHQFQTDEDQIPALTC